MSFNSDVQQLEIEGKVRLIVVDGSKFGAGVLRFHNHSIPFTAAEIDAAGGDPDKLRGKVIMYGGQEFGPWPVTVEGLETSTDGAPSEPSMKVGNADGTIGALCLAFNDMKQAKVQIIDTLAKYLDNGESPSLSERKLRTFFIDRKEQENDEGVVFTLASPYTMEGLQIPARTIQPICEWGVKGWYKSGNGCHYKGQNGFFNEKGERVQDESMDVCGCLVKDCKLRFGENEELDFGGMPAAGLIR